MKKQIPLLVVSVLLVLMLVVGSVLFISQKNYTDTRQQVDRSMIDGLDSQITNLSTTRDDLTSQMTIAKNTILIDEKSNTDNLKLIADIKNQLSDLTTKLQTSESDKEALNKDLNDYKTKLTSYSDEIDTLGNRVKCSDLVVTEPDYTSNTTISKSLSEMIADHDGSIIKATWDVVYGNSKTAIHKISGQKYLWVFVVTFKGDLGSDVNSIFDVGGGCFVDFP